MESDLLKEPAESPRKNSVERLYCILWYCIHAALTSQRSEYCRATGVLDKSLTSFFSHLRLVENYKENGPKVFARQKVFIQQGAKPSYKVIDPRTLG